MPLRVRIASVKSKPGSRVGLFYFALSLIICAGFWHWTSAILLPANGTAAMAAGRPIGNNSDLYPRWLGSRELLLHGRDPYGDDVTREIQTGFYGRPLDAHNPGDPTWRESFVYPVYAVFLLAPTVNMRFASVRHVASWLALACIAFAIPLWMRAIGFRKDLLTTLSLMTLAVSTYPAVMEFHMQNMAALVIFFLAAATAAMARGWMLLAGFLLALATIKPDISGLFILWISIWALGQWNERKRLVWSFAGTMAALVGTSLALMPHWIPEFIHAVVEYPSYGGEPNLLQILLPRVLAIPAVVILLTLLFFLCYRWRKATPGTAAFSWSMALVIGVTLAILPKQSAYNHVLLSPLLLVLLSQYSAISKSGLLARALTKGAFVCQIWPWVAALVLSLIWGTLPQAIGLKLVYLPVLTSLTLPAITILAVLAGLRAQACRAFTFSPEADLSD
jgi:Glycosyltransferase family 87